MTIHVDPIELAWVLINSTTAVVTLVALLDAWEDRQAVKGRGASRDLMARGNVRRETIRLIVQLLLLSLVIPGIFIQRETQLTPPVIALMTMAVVLLVASILDARDRGKLAHILDADIVTERDAQFDRLSQQITEGTQASHAAEEAANNTQDKIANLNERLIEQADRTTAEMHRTDQHQGIQDERIEAVEEGDA